MKLSIHNVNRFLFFKLPIAWWAGVRVQGFSDHKVSCIVHYRWINQNPFKSMFWAVQGMAAELSTGIMLMDKIQQQSQKISMLVITQRSEFYKKAVGKITFECTQQDLIIDAVHKTINTRAPQTLYLSSKGINEQEEVVSFFEFKWSIYCKSC